jgi:hypothetical protein
MMESQIQEDRRTKERSSECKSAVIPNEEEEQKENQRTKKRNNCELVSRNERLQKPHLSLLIVSKRLSGHSIASMIDASITMMCNPRSSCGDSYD